MHGPAVHVDTAEFVPASVQTGGARYARPAEPAPPIACPNCGRTVDNIKAGTPAYLRSFTDPEFGTLKKDRTLPPCPVSGFDAEILFMTAEPCGCRVHNEWAGAFAAERSHRKMGLPPKLVTGPSPQQIAKENQKLTDALAKLYGLQAEAEGPQKLAVDYWIVVVGDQLQRLHPGQHNIAASPRSLESEVRNWASENGHTMPTDPVDPFGLNPHPGKAETWEYGSKYPMPKRYKQAGQSDQADAAAYAALSSSLMLPPPAGQPGTPMMRRPAPAVQVALPDTVIAQVIGVIDHHGSSDVVAGVIDLMLEQGGRSVTAAARLEAMTVLRRHLVKYQSNGGELHPNAYYFVTTLLSYVDLEHPGTKAIPVLKPKPAGKKLPGPASTQEKPVDKLARKKRTIRRLNPDDQKS